MNKEDKWKNHLEAAWGRYQDNRLKEGIIKCLDETPEGEGGGTKYRIKGIEYDLRNLPTSKFMEIFRRAEKHAELMNEKRD